MIKNSLPLSDALVMLLDDLDLTYAFSVSGANIEHFHDAVARCASKLNNIVCKSEFSAAFIAQGYARHTQSMGLCCATSGGGMMNLVAGIAEARASCVPLLAIIGAPSKYAQTNGAFQDAPGGANHVDAYALCNAVAKVTLEVNPGDFWQQLFDAISQAVSDVPGPSILLIPRDVMSAQVSERPDHWPISLAKFKQYEAMDELTYQRFVSAFKMSKRALLIAGAELFYNDNLINFAEQFSLPVATTLGAPAAFPQSHELFVGMVGIAGHTSTHKLVDACDLLIVIGSQLKLTSRAPIEKLLHNKPIWIINQNIDDLPNNDNIVGLRSNPNDFINYAIADESLTQVCVSELQPLTIEKYDPPVIPNYQQTQGLLLKPTLSIIQNYLSAYTNILFDAGNCSAAAAHYLQIPDHANAYVALGMGGMGYAISSAIGVQLASSNSGLEKTLVICGDGAFFITGAEVHTAVELALPILWVICNDSQHGMCASRQRVLFDSRLTATQYSPADFSIFARGLAPASNLWVGRAQSYAQLECLLSDYLQLKKPLPGVLEIVMHQYDHPPFHLFTADNS